jgi:hypothetical protein
VAGATFAVTVELRDSTGQRVAASHQVSLAVQGPGALLGTTSAAAASGIATFTGLSIETAGPGYRLVATATGLAQATTASFDVSPALAAKLAFAVQPTDAFAGVAISPAVQVAVEDAFGNLAPDGAVTVTLALQGGGAGAALEGGEGRPASGGIATFDALGVASVAAHYTLAATASGLTGAVSQEFAVAPAGLVLLAATGASSSLGAVYRPGAGWSTVAMTGGSSDAPAVALTTSCAGVAIRRGSGDAVEASLWSPLDGWSAYAAIGAGATTGATPALGANGVAVQAAFRGLDYKLYATTFQAGWAAVESVGSGAGASITASAPTLAVSSGDAVVAYGADTTPYPTVRTRSAGVWGSPASISTDFPVSTSTDVVLATPSAGPELLAVWSSGSATQQLYFATRTTGTWSAASAIAGAVILGGDRPALAQGAAGAVMLGYRGSDGTLSWAQYSGAAWSTPAALLAGGVSALAAPALAPGVAGADYELVYDGTDGAAHHSRFSGGAWSTPALVGGSGVTGIALTSAMCSSP